VKVVWGFGGSALGVTADEWQLAMDNTDMSALSRLLERFGIDITVLASLVGVLLVLALLQRWGLYLPRWLLLLPAWIGGISLTLYGVPLAVWGSLTLAGVVSPATDSGAFTPTGLAWMVLFGGAAFTGLGTALAVGARSYQRRSQPLCATPAAQRT
jgi:D-alanyl-D-alanine dipeptidase